MPLNNRKLSALLFSVILFAVAVSAQSPTTTDVMIGKISKAKALVATKNYAAAIYELEGIKRETNDPTVTNVAQVILMVLSRSNDYKRARAYSTGFSILKKPKSIQLLHRCRTGGKKRTQSIRPLQIFRISR